MEEPDFESYNLDELKQVYHRIDRERFPDRFQKIEAILNDPEKVEVLRHKKSKHDDIEPILSIVYKKVIAWPKKYSTKEAVTTVIVSIFTLGLILYMQAFPLKGGQVIYAYEHPTFFYMAIGIFSLYCAKYFFIALYKIIATIKK
jgi:hypothetical protein